MSNKIKDAFRRLNTGLDYLPEHDDWNQAKKKKNSNKLTEEEFDAQYDLTKSSRKRKMPKGFPKI